MFRRLLCLSRGEEKTKRKELSYLHSLTIQQKRVESSMAIGMASIKLKSERKVVMMFSKWEYIERST